MSAKNIQMKNKNGNTWDNLYPITLSENVFDKTGKSVASQLNETMDKVSDFNLFPQSPKPQKNGDLSNSYKIVKKSENKMDIIQKTNKGYLHHTLMKDFGVDDYDPNHQLLRLVNTTYSLGAYLYFDISTPINGEITKSWDADEYGTLDKYLFGNNNRVDVERNLNSGKPSASVYRIEPSEKFEWNVPTGVSDKINFMFLGTTGSSNDVEISLNDIIIDNVNLRAYHTTEDDVKTSLIPLEYNFPKKNNNTTNKFVKVSLENKGTGNILISAINFYELSAYDGQAVTDFKALGTNRRYLTSGANDYAIRDANNGKLFGSYHGGEISETIQLYFNKGVFPQSSESEKNSFFDDLNNDDWCAIKNFYIYQRTNLANDQAKMTSRFDFNTNGTIEMEFGYRSDSLKIKSFRTAMSCTHTNFRHLTYPIYYLFPQVPSEEFYYIPTTEGKVSQVNSIDHLQLDIRFTKFNQHFEKSGAFVNDSNTYRKFYYGPLDNSTELTLKNLSFSKGMDFYVR